MTTINHGYANVNGIRLHYAEAGKGDLVLLLHGFPEFWYSWRHQIEALASRFHVVAPDMRGANLTDKPLSAADYTIDLLVQDVIGLIDFFGAQKAAIVGHDWGASVAWAIAQKYPERVSKLAALQVPPAPVWRANMTGRQFLRSWYMLFFQLPKVPEFLLSKNDFEAIRKVFKESVGRKNTFSDEDIARYVEALRQPGALTAAVNYYRGNIRRLVSRMNKRGAKSDLAKGRVRVPTLFIFGEQDHAVLPATVRNVRGFIDAPYFELRIPDSGHWVQNEAADEVNEALLKFLTSEFEVELVAAANV